MIGKINLDCESLIIHIKHIKKLVLLANIIILVILQVDAVVLSRLPHALENQSLADM